MTFFGAVMEQLLEFIGNHILLVLVFVSLLAALIGLEIRRALGMPRIEPSQATRLINRENALVVDVRDMGDFKKGHIVGAVNIPASKLEDHKNRLPEEYDRPLVICCGTGLSAPQVASRLAKLGYRRLFILRGGMPSWTEAGLPLEKAS